MSAAKPRKGAYNFNESSCDSDIVSGSLPAVYNQWTGGLDWNGLDWNGLM